MQEQSIEKKYEKAFEQVASLNPIFPNMAREQMAEMAEVIARSHENIASRLSTNQSFEIKGGFIAEEVHAETFNLEATLRKSDARAITDRYKTEWQSQGLKVNDTPDIVVINDDGITTKAQLKYYRTSKETAGQFSQINKDGTAKYGDVDAYIGPSDQVAPTKGQKSIAANATERANYKASEGNSFLNESFKQTADKITDKLSDGESSSTPFTKSDANEMGKGNLEKLKKIENRYQTKSTVQQMGSAAAGAAAMAAIVSGSVNTIRYVQLVREGEMTAEDATLKIIGETVAAAADSAIKASTNAGVQSLIVRYGEKAFQGVLAKQGVRAMLKTNAITVGVVCAIDAVKDLVHLGANNISKEDFFERQGKGLLMTSSGVVGGGLGMAGATFFAGTLGASTGSLSIAAASVIGSLSGGIIAGLAMALAIENGIDKPYRNLMENSAALYDAARELERVSQTVFMGQVLFTEYLEANANMDQLLHAQFSKIDEAGVRALDAINKI